MGQVVHLPVFELLGLAVVPVLHRAVVAGDAAVYLGGLAADGAGELFPGEVAVVGTHGVGGGHGVIGKLVVLRDLPHQVGRRLPGGQLLAQKGVEHGAGGVEGLELVLNVQSGEDVLGVAHGQVGGVGVVGSAVLVGGDDVGELLLVVLGEAVGGGLGGGGLQVIEVAVLLLIVAQALPHVVEHVLGELLGLRVGQVGPEPLGVEAYLIHADEADGGEVVIKASQITLCIGVQARVQQLGNDGALGLQAAGGDVHELVQPLVEVGLVLGQIGDAGQVDGDHAHTAGGLAGAEEAAGLLPQLPQVQAQAAAHAAHVGGLHVGVDIVGEVGGAVLGGHLKEELIIFRLGPVEVLGDGVGGDGVLEAPAVGIALNHDLDEGFIDHVHLFFAVAVGEVHLLAPHNGGQVLQILGHRPVQGDVGEGGLGAPAAGGVHPVDKALDALLDLLLGQVVHLHKGGQIGVKGGEGLGPRPLVLHDAQEVDHLVAQGGQVLGRGGGDFSGNAPQPLLDELLQGPAGAVAGEHAQVVEVDLRVAVGVGNLLVVDLGEPVVGGDGPGVGENEAAHRVGDGGVLLHPPVVDLQVVVHQLLVVEQGGVDVSHLLPLFAVEDVGLGHVGVARLRQDLLHAVLDVLHGDAAVPDLGLKVCGHPQGQQVDDGGVELLVQGLEGLGDGGADFSNLKLGGGAVPLGYLVHTNSLTFLRPILNSLRQGRAVGGVPLL